MSHQVDAILVDVELLPGNVDDVHHSVRRALERQLRFFSFSAGSPAAAPARGPDTMRASAAVTGRATTMLAVAFGEIVSIADQIGRQGTVAVQRHNQGPFSRTVAVFRTYTDAISRPPASLNCRSDPGFVAPLGMAPGRHAADVGYSETTSGEVLVRSCFAPTVVEFLASSAFKRDFFSLRPAIQTAAAASCQSRCHRRRQPATAIRAGSPRRCR